MIRRKLTRIEVTLDDTKDLDEYFSRASNNSASGLVGTTAGAGSTTPACSSKTPSQLYQLYTKHYSLGTTSHQATFDSSIDQQQSSLAALGTSTSTHQARAAIDNTTTNYPNDSIGTLVTNLTPSGDQPQQTSDSDSLRYNPQPQNQFSRFNQNI